MSCEAEQKNNFTVGTASTRNLNVDISQNMPDYLMRFVNSISDNLSVIGATQKRESIHRDIETITPIINDSDTLMWVVNYSNRKGYLILSTERNTFPIIAFYNEGRFDSNAKTNAWIDNIIKSKKKKNENVYSELWDKILTPTAEDREISFELITNVDDLGKQTNYVNVDPLVWTQWGTGWGYHYEMPVVTEQIFGTHKAEVPEFLVTMGQYMHYYRYPDRYNYDKMLLSLGAMQPSLDRPNEIATMLWSLYMTLGLEIDPSINGVKVPPQYVCDIFYILRMFGYSNCRFSYWVVDGDKSYQTYFNDIYEGLIRGYPTIGGVVVKLRDIYSPWDEGDKIQYTFIIDGIKEIGLKITEKNTLGSQTYTYKDFYVRYLRPTVGNFSNTGPNITGGDYTGWYKLDGIYTLYDNPYYRVYAACIMP